MRLRKFGHSCLLVEANDTRLLLDPGVFSPGVSDVEGLSAILVTHQHPDHLDLVRLPALLERNPDARIVTDAGTADLLRDGHGIDATAVSPGERLQLGVDVEVVGGTHAEIYREIPRIPNVGFLIDGRLLHPGDALDAPNHGRDIEILALPTMAPWMRMAEAIDYLRAVKPRLAVPIHEAMVRSTDIYYGAFRTFAPAGTELTVLDDGEPVTV
jgi:L-ascorbate metabolism protein UlaG (beta-lactamase superfamily)